MNNVLTEEPLRTINGILDYMGDFSSEFFDDFEAEVSLINCLYIF